jgi:hypothetical protein
LSIWAKLRSGLHLRAASEEKKPLSPNGSLSIADWTRNFCFVEIFKILNAKFKPALDGESLQDNFSNFPPYDRLEKMAKKQNKTNNSIHDRQMDRTGFRERNNTQKLLP